MKKVLLGFTFLFVFATNSLAQYVYPQTDFNHKRWLVDMIQLGDAYFGLGSVSEFNGNPVNKIFKFQNNQVTTYEGNVFAELDSSFEADNLPFDMILSSDTSLLFINYYYHPFPNSLGLKDSFAIFEIDLNMENLIQRTPFVQKEDYAAWAYFEGDYYYVSNVLNNQGFKENMIFKFNGTSWENLNFTYPGWMSDLLVYEGQLIARGDEAGPLNLGLARFTETGWQEFSTKQFYSVASITNFNDTLFVAANGELDEEKNNYFLFKYFDGTWEKIEDSLTGIEHEQILSSNEGLIVINEKNSRRVNSDTMFIQIYRANKLYNLPDTFRMERKRRFLIDYNGCHYSLDRITFIKNGVGELHYDGMKICNEEIVTNIPFTKKETTQELTIVHAGGGSIEISNHATTSDKVYIYNLMGQLILEIDVQALSKTSVPLNSGFYVWTNKKRSNSGKLLIGN
ncbi:MAG: hypothetical protein ACJATA_000551 [Sphingobacteriales bacterium]|jgi:hypothetical protein